MHHENRHEMVPPILRRGPQPRQRGKARQRGRDPVNGLNANSVDGLTGLRAVNEPNSVDGLRA